MNDLNKEKQWKVCTDPNSVKQTNKQNDEIQLINSYTELLSETYIDKCHLNNSW